MEQIIVFILFYILYAVFQMVQRRMGGGNKKPSSRPPAKAKKPDVQQQQAPARETREQPETKMPDFLRRWMEEARRLEEEAQLKEQSRPATPATVLDFEVPDEAETVTAESGPIVTAAELSEQVKMAEKRRAVLLDQFDLRLSPEGDVNRRRRQLARLLGKPESFKNALLLQEILSRPVSLRRRVVPYYRQE